MSQSEKVVELLVESPPLFHGAGGDMAYSIDGHVLYWLLDNVRAGWVTLETGCGSSSVVFALKGAIHTTISPSKLEHDLVRGWCESRGISTASITFIADGSQRVLPVLEPVPLDLVLIDGCHAVPYPMIDWFYTAERLKVGGYVIIDDTPIPACKDLQVFLQSEVGRWRLVREFDNTAIFEKLVPNAIEGLEFVHQPYCSRRAVGFWRRTKTALLFGLINTVKKSQWLADRLRPIYRSLRARRFKASVEKTRTR